MESLHNHTTTSDGKMTHWEAFEEAARRGFFVYAFTDHDALPNAAALEYLESVRKQSPAWIIGMEITALLPRDLSERGVVHVIGLFLDPSNKGLQEHALLAQDARRVRMEGMVKNLRELGFAISAEECEEEAAGDSVGRPHIVRVLARHEKNREVTEHLRREMEQEAAHDERIEEKYRRMVARGKEQYPYSLFLSPDAYRPAYREMTYLPDLDHAVRLIREAGGIASIAHYESVRTKLPLSSVEKLLKAGRLDAMETVYGAGYYGTPLEDEIHNERRAIREIVRRAGALETGGGDIHTIEDLERYVDLDGFANETAGFTERLVASGKVDPRWSSIVSRVE